MEKKKIAIVDDEEDLTWSISRYLNRHESYLDVVTFNSPALALEYLLENKVNLVISDLRMPRINGLELLTGVRKKWPNVHSIIMTAYGADILKNGDGAIENFLFIEKPFELQTLRRYIIDLVSPDEKEMQAAYAQSRIKEMVETNCLSHKTTMMLIENGLHNGRIYVKKGQIVHAECGELEGENALQSILDWDQVDYYTTPHFTCEKKTITRDWKTLLNSNMIE
ncbi:response regulator [candidate division KSB1 bacterium]|nr:response regulator [candidate division KSB1 bacterium]